MKNNIQETIERFRSEFGLHFDKSELQFAEAFLEEEFEKALNDILPERDVAYKPAGNGDNLEGWNACREEIKQNINNFLNK